MSSSRNRATHSSRISESRISSGEQGIDDTAAAQRVACRDIQLEEEATAATHGRDLRECKRQGSVNVTTRDSVEEKLHRRRNPPSGGFLLGSIGYSSHHAAKVAQAKARGGEPRFDGGDIKQARKSMLEKSGKGVARSKGKEPESIGRAPLGVGITHEDGSREKHRINYTLKGEAAASECERPQQQLVKSPSVFDTEQAKLVSLALNLSENRRRQFSAGKLSPADRIGSPLAVASETLPRAFPADPAVDRKPGLQIQQEYQNFDSLPQAYNKVILESPHSSSGAQHDPSSERKSLPVLLAAISDPADYSNFHPSDATLLRVERAKTELELFYEYRRLLQYLPKLPVCQDSRPMPVGSSALLWSESPEGLGRIYNPLQYIRNRKVRSRERGLLNSEAEGWKDVDAVRVWIDQIVRERHKYPPNPYIGFVLPPYPAAPKTSSPSLESSGVNLNLSATGSVARELRSRIDWRITPWDMLADVCWLENSGNKALIEDQKGQKLYGVKRLNTLTHNGALKDPQPLLARRSLSVPRSVTGDERYKKADAISRDTVVLERGRPRHQRLQSFTSAREYSSSQDRRGGWRRRLIRSASPSSSEESGPFATRKAYKSRNYAPANRERQSTLILEKQVMRLLAKEAKAREVTLHKEGRNQVLSNTTNKRTAGLQQDSNDKDRQSSGSPQKQQNTPLTTTQPVTPPRYLLPQDNGEKRRSRDISGMVENGVLESHPRGNIAINVPPPRSRSRRRSYQPEGSSPNAKVPVDRTIRIERAHSSHTSDYRRSEIGPYSDGDGSGQSPKTEPSIGYLSPQSAGSFGRLKTSVSRSRNAKIRDSKDFESKLRGLLKGTKIADIVGNPVARVGDYIWKREGGDGDVFHDPSPYTLVASDLEEDSQKSLSLRLEKNSEHPSHGQSGSRPELPVFRSPFKSREGGQERTITSEMGSSTQLAGNRKSDRFAQIALPPLDTRPISPSPVRGRMLLADSGEKDISNAERLSSRESVRDQDTRAIQRRHAIANHLSHPSTRQETVYETALEPDPSQNTNWLGHDSLYFMNITERLLSPRHRFVQAHDIRVLRSLTQSATVISSEIKRQICGVRQQSAVQETLYQLNPVRSKSANMYVQVKTREAKAITQGIRFKKDMIDQTMKKVSDEMMPSITEGLKDLERKISLELTPVVRSTGTSADELGAELATTRTLELKRLNDSIDLYARRKRRRFRWIRRGIYLLLEWTLLGLMWWAWLIVVVIKTLRASIEGFIAALEWLFWL